MVSEKLGWLTLPWLILLSADCLEELHVSGRLGKNVMKIISDRNEVETQLQKLSNSVGAKQEEPWDNLVFCTGSEEFVGCVIQLFAGVHLREDIFFVEPHAHAKVILSQECQIKAFDRQDIVDVFDA